MWIEIKTRIGGAPPTSRGVARRRVARVALGLAMSLSVSSTASAQARDPLSAIDWLSSTHAASMPSQHLLLEPPVAQSGLGPDITVTSLQQLLPAIGLVSARRTGLPVALWQNSSAERLSHLIRHVPVQGSPAMQSLLLTLLLAETRPPYDDNDQLLLARLDRLMEIGATDPVQALAQEAGPTESTARFSRWFDATLLNGDEDRSCAALTAKPSLNGSYPARIFCAARRGDWPTAALMLDAAEALELMTPRQAAVLDRFLNPDFFEGLPPLPLPSAPTPLEFRLFEAIGEPMPTAALPRAFASADLRDIVGWKAQLEAAERLTRSRAMNPNQLLGLFTAREAAASGGIWDRVMAVQYFDAALDTASSAAISKTLPALWRAARASGLELAMADLFGDRLADIPLDGPPAQTAWRLRLLSSAYERAAQTPPDDSTQTLFLAELAKGTPSLLHAATLPDAPRAEAIARAFAPESELPAAQHLLLEQGRLGEAILLTMRSFAHGAEGNLEALTLSLAALRHMGLEDTARRAALQLMILGKR